MSRISGAIRREIASLPKVRSRDELLAEHRAIREEIGWRHRSRHQDLTSALVLLGAIVAFADQYLAVLIFPMLVFGVSLHFLVNDERIYTLGAYLRERVEPTLSGVKWETVWDRIREDESSHRVARLSGRFIFLGTSFIAIVVAVTKFAGLPERTGWEWCGFGILLLLDLICIGWMAFQLRNFRN